MECLKPFLPSEGGAVVVVVLRRKEQQTGGVGVARDEHVTPETGWSGRRKAMMKRSTSRDANVLISGRKGRRNRLGNALSLLIEVERSRGKQESGRP